MFYTIYQITNIINNKKYIGKHITPSLEDNYLGSGLAISRAIKKYGKKNFTKEILFVFNNETDMNNKEVEIVNSHIVESDRYYNIALGGYGGCIVLKDGHPLKELTIKKIKETKSSQKQMMSERAKMQHAAGNIGMYGRKQTDHQKRRVSEVQKGRERSLRSEQLRIQSLRNTVNAPGYIHPNKGRKRSETSKQRQKDIAKSQPNKVCPHCGKEMDIRNYGRYHGDRCKNKIDTQL